MFKWYIGKSSTNQLFVTGYLISVKVVRKATSYLVRFLGESREFLGKPVRISTSSSLISRFGEMWQKADNSTVIPLMAAKDATWDTYIIAWIAFFPAGMVLSVSSSESTEHVHHLWVWLGFIPSSVLAAGHCTSFVETDFHRDAEALSRKKDGCMLSVEAHWESSYMDTGQNKNNHYIKCPTILIA